MNKIQIEERLKTLLAERDRMAGLYEGAIQDCNFWLQQIEKSAEVEVPTSEEEQIKQEDN